MNEKKQFIQSMYVSSSIQNKSKEKVVPVSFTISKKQYEKLQLLKSEGYCKIMYIIRFAVFYIIKTDVKNIRSYKDGDFSVAKGIHYNINIPKDINKQLNKLKEKTGFSKSKLIRIALNDILYFIK